MSAPASPNVIRRCLECGCVLQVDQFTQDRFTCDTCFPKSPLAAHSSPKSPTFQNGPESVKVSLRKPGAADAVDVFIVRDMTMQQLGAYLQGVLGGPAASIAGLPLHPPTLCKELHHGKEYAVIMDVVPPPPAELPATLFPATGAKYDLVVIGSGPGGEAAAVLASQLGVRVAILEKKHLFGGPTGLTSKATRHVIKTILTTSATIGDQEAILRKLWGGFPDLLKAAMLGQTIETRTRLEQNRVHLIIVDDVKISHEGTRVTIRRGDEMSILQTKYIIIATGSRPARPAHIPFTPDKVVDAAEIAPTIGKKLPGSIGIIGGGIVGVEYALVLASVGVKVTVFSTPELFMKIVPIILRKEIMGTLEKSKITTVMSPVDSVEVGPRCAIAAGGQRHEADVVLYSMGRDANSDGLGLEDLGIELGKYGRIVVDSNFCTNLPNIFAIGDVIGGRLASVASKAGRAAAKFIFRGITDEESPQLFASKMEDLPLALWTVPEMASVGATEEEIRVKGLLRAEEGGPIVVGVAKYANLVQGRLAGGEGFVQVIAHYTPHDKHRIIGAQIFGAFANDLIQVMALLIDARSTLEVVANTPWAAVTMSVLLQHAADDGLFRSPYFHPESSMPTGSPLRMRPSSKAFD